MSLLERLIKKQEYLEVQYEQILKKLKRLRKDLGIESDPEIRYKLYERIKELKEELADVEEELDSIEEKISKSDRQSVIEVGGPQEDISRLYQALLKLGYWDQQRLFEKATLARQNSCGAFLIQGRSKDFGQRWLLNRLATVIPNNLEGKRIKIDLSRTSSRSDINAIWGEFAGRVNLPEESPTCDIVERVIELWRSQNILISFDNVDNSIQENVRDLINNFWNTLANRIREDNANSINTFKLLMFLLDYQGVVIRWNIGFLEDCSQDWKPGAPIGLPNISPFSAEVLRTWLEQQSDRLPEDLTLNKAETIQVLLEKKGIPMPTLRKICDLCHYNWFSQEERWLRL